MYHYTPNKEMLDQLFKARKLGFNRKINCSSDYAYAIQVCRNNYKQVIAFLEHWERTNFYSAIKRSEIPVNGVLFPASFFEEQINPETNTDE